MTCVETTGDTYILVWSPTKLESVINLTLSEKQRLIMLLVDDPQANHLGNPVRDWIVHCVSNQKRGYEIWQVTSDYTEEEITGMFWDSQTQSKTKSDQ